ncbi:hypothetical protein DFH29DRAFT_1006887 [Suillus ampliporus]|nr:hypothetical protein DFH29DRAFT_1006887 [Suillus ampliporus]
MPRANSFTDFIRRSWTPGLEGELVSSLAAPRSASPVHIGPSLLWITHDPKRAPTLHFQMCLLRKAISMHRTTTVFLGFGLASAQLDVNLCRQSAYLHHTRIRERREIQIADYSTSRGSFERLDNDHFVKLSTIREV